MHPALQSRTVAGLVIILAIGCVFEFLGKLTPELADLLKFAFGAFVLNRTATNVAESRMPSKDPT